MTALTRVVTILEALADANVPNPKAVELIKLFNDTVDSGASDENEAIAFLDKMGKHLSGAIMHSAEVKAKQEAQAAIKAARQAASDKIPPGVSKRNANSNRNNT